MPFLAEGREPSGCSFNLSNIRVYSLLIHRTILNGQLRAAGV